jgi:Ca-activated chloride channel family protein
MRKAFVGVVCLLAGCGAGSRGASRAPETASTARDDGRATTTETTEVAVATDEATPRNAGTWIGAAAESDVLMADSNDTLVGVWVDAPLASARAHARPKMDLALVIDTSGSMAGDKIASARAAAKTLLESTGDGDVVSIDTFDNEARQLIPPTVITHESRTRLERVVSGLETGGSTNMFDGLELGESQLMRAPATHVVRRLVLISDGKANVGPSTPEALAMVAQRGIAFHAQITSLGVGIDYDESTLNALAVRSSGRLYHLGEPTEMASTLRREMDLLGSTVASDAFVEVVPAPGVQIQPVEGIAGNWGANGAFVIPLGVLFGGQHREVLVRARFVGMEHESEGPRPIASVRLHFRDPSDGDVERVQEVVARAGFTHNADEVASHANARTRSIVAIQDAAKLQMQAAQNVNAGQFDQADSALASAETKLRKEAQVAKDANERQRLTAAAASVGAARGATHAAAAAPAPVRREKALELNKSGMSGLGY